MPRFYTFRALFLAGAFAAAASLSVLDVTPIGSTCRSLLAMQQWQAREDASGNGCLATSRCLRPLRRAFYRRPRQRPRQPKPASAVTIGQPGEGVEIGSFLRFRAKLDSSSPRIDA